MSLPVPESERKLSSLEHSQGLGRLSALSLLLYFGIGPCVNITMFGNEDLPSLVVPVAGGRTHTGHYCQPQKASLSPP